MRIPFSIPWRESEQRVWSAATCRRFLPDATRKSGDKSPHSKHAALPEGSAGFTMIEIALCLAVIGFALAAIIGILPLGLQVQQENREETIVGQDGPYFLEAIRSGARNLNELTNYVETIIQVRPNGQSNPAVSSFVSGAAIIGLLSDPTMDRSYAYVRSISGAATENGRDSGSQIGFRYLLSAEVKPTQFYTNDLRWQLAQTLQTNLHEVRVAIRYPLLANNQYGSGKQVFRALVGGRIETNNFGYFFSPNNFEPLP